jgi:hypothetical protein
MEFMIRQLRSCPSGALALLMAGALCTACGPQVIEGRPPFVGIASMSLSDGRLATEFRVDNQNEVPMNIQAFEVSVTAGDVMLTRDTRQLDLLIDANSAEEILVEESPAQDVMKLLDSLEQREVNSLSFEMNGRVRTLEDGYLRFEQKGHLYPVPGRPGSFRSAVTQAQNLRRDEKL